MFFSFTWTEVSKQELLADGKGLALSSCLIDLVTRREARCEIWRDLEHLPVLCIACCQAHIDLIVQH